MRHPDKDQILEAANTSPEAKVALQKLYPELFPSFDDWFLEELGKTTFKFEEEEGVFGYQGNAIVLRYFPDSKNLYILNSKWELAETFELEHEQVQNLIKEQVQKHCKVEGCKPFRAFSLASYPLQKHC